MSLDTVHSNTTEHGLDTPHMYPDPLCLATDLDTLDELNTQLYPTGRAWYKTEGGVWDRFHRAINVSFLRLIRDAENLINITLPDNDDFLERDATLWEHRLGLITNEGNDLEVRKSLISRKLGHPNNIIARQHPLFIQSQLQEAGFDVYVHENRPPYMTPQDFGSMSTLNSFRHDSESRHGQGARHGGTNFELIANSIEPIEFFAVGEDNIWSTFFIGGQSPGDVAMVPFSRLREFKELVIKLKPAHTIAYTFINYL